jgi:putative metallopeptidase
MTQVYTNVASDQEPAKYVEQLLKDKEKHEKFWHLKEARIRMLWVDPDMKKGDRLIYGKAKLVTGLLRYFIQMDFIIFLSEALWQTLSDSQRLALIEHELTHCGVKTDDNGIPLTVDNKQVQYDKNDKPITKGIELAWCIKQHDYQGFYHDLTLAEPLPGFEELINTARQSKFDFAAAE